MVGPMTHTFADGSTVQLAQGASIRTFADAGRRGFEHVAGRIDVSVAKGQGEFVVTTPYGQVTALGTQFTMDLVDGVAANTKEPVRLLAVEVAEGSVQVSNPKGSSLLKERQKLIVEANQKPYDFSRDPSVPEKVRQRIAAMVTALEGRDAAAWLANYNIDYMYKLVKGQEAYDPQRFAGRPGAAPQGIRRRHQPCAARGAFRRLRHPEFGQDLRPLGEAERGRRPRRGRMCRIPGRKPHRGDESQVAPLRQRLVAG
jgi:hypothetical protein